MVRGVSTRTAPGVLAMACTQSTAVRTESSVTVVSGWPLNGPNLAANPPRTDGCPSPTQYRSGCRTSRYPSELHRHPTVSFANEGATG